MQIAGVTYEKFDSTYEVEMLKLFADREIILDKLKRFEEMHIGNNPKFNLIELVQCLLEIREISLAVVESVVRKSNYLLIISF